MSEIFALGNNYNGTLGYHDHQCLRIDSKIKLSLVNRTLACSGMKNSSCFLLGNGRVYQVIEYKNLLDLNVENIQEIASGSNHYLALTNEGKVYTWSSLSRSNIFGSSQQKNWNIPMLLEELSDKGITSVHATDNCSFFLNEYSGDLYASGKNELGICLTESKMNQFLPTTLVQTSIDRLFTGFSSHGFFQKSNGEIKGFGKNDEFQLGISDKKINEISRIVPELKEYRIKDISLGMNFSMALTTDGKILSCGNKDSISTKNNRTTFAPYPQLKNIFMSYISSGNEFSVSTSNEGEVWVFGKYPAGKVSVPTKIYTFKKPCRAIKCSHSSGVWFYSAKDTISSDLFKLYKTGDVSDCKIKGIPLHKIFVECRLKKKFDEICKILENKTKRETLLIMNWVYSGEFKTEPKETFRLLQLFDFKNLGKHKLRDDLKKLLKDDDSKDFNLLIPDIDQEEEEEEEGEGGEGEDDFEEIPVHKFILAARSGLFRDMFRNIEQKENNVKDYSNKSLEAIELIIDFIYTGDCKVTADTDVSFVIDELEDAQDYYQLNPDCNILRIFKDAARKF
ncbi:hypothetical protein M0813_28834 [Anaeramoeba flamelloides]|uniref:BTB domain-containing protein n=1 Tax=Anaeramoeba flamelloides TaxID=1746091 RepID=A0ABQ8XSC6_9EUKA|nr:hypothetical protein M0813_28834 [Anaeramoeba flamelloides]